MGFEKLRLLFFTVTCVTAGALAALAGDSARMWVGAFVMLLPGIAVVWPLARARTMPPFPPAPAPTLDAQRLLTLETYLERLPVAAWVQIEGQTLQPLTSRARRLAAAGGLRNHDALRDSLARHDNPVVLETERGAERWQLQRQSLALSGQSLTLLVLTPLERVLESEALQAWQQLVQVLTHEIMNSLTPIQSLSHTASSLVNEPGDGTDLRTALDAIARRADSLSHFVHTYRRVGRVPEPVMAPVDLRHLFDRLQQAVAPAWTARGGEARFDLASPTLRLLADEGQLEQALLALIHNAEQATADDHAPRLWVEARQSRGGRLLITVRDNGPGVPAGLERQIFLPFFSTREDGQGIGLSLVRQLMHGMGGRVRHVRTLERGASFALIF